MTMEAKGIIRDVMEVHHKIHKGFINLRQSSAYFVVK